MYKKIIPTCVLASVCVHTSVHTCTHTLSHECVCVCTGYTTMYMPVYVYRCTTCVCIQLMLERMWGKGNTPALLVGVQTCTADLEISTMMSQKIRKQSTSRPSNTIVGYIPKRHSLIPQGHMLNYTHSSIFL